tara:strand:+ start:14122 stop:14301 length:180 start_codon:yes stop_codon:yes gene_type:complete
MNDNKNSVLDDIRGALGNIGNQGGVKFEVTLDKKTMTHLTILFLTSVTLGVGLTVLFRK